VVKPFSVEAAVPAAMPWIVAGGTPIRLRSGHALPPQRQTNGAQRRGYNISVLSVRSVVEITGVRPGEHPAKFACPVAGIVDAGRLRSKNGPGSPIPVTTTDSCYS